MALMDKVATLAGNYSSILSLIQSLGAQDALYVLDKDGNKLYTQASIMRVVVDHTSHLTEYEIESIGNVSDYTMHKLLRMQLVLIVDATYAQDVVSALNAARTSSSVLSVQTRTGAYPSVCVTSVSTEESIGSGLCVGITVGLCEVRQYTAKYDYVEVRVKSDRDTRDLGETTPSEDLPRESVLSGMISREVL